MRDVQNRQPVLNADRGFAIRQFMTRSLGVAAAAAMMISLTPSARAVSLINPGAAPAAKQASDALLTQVQHRGGRGGGGGGGFRGGGGGGHAFHGGGGGGFRGGGMPAFRGGGGGGGFRAAAPAFRGGGGFRPGPAFVGGGFRRGPAFHGGGYRYAAPLIARRPYYAPTRYYGARHYGYRRHFRPHYYAYAPSYYYGPRYYQPRRFCRDRLDLLRPTQDLPLSPLASPPLAPPAALPSLQYLLVRWVGLTEATLHTLRHGRA
jgi:hypothetical protein